MRVKTRKGPPHRTTHKVPVVVELWMTVEEAQCLSLSETSKLATAIRETIKEHLTSSRFACSRDVKE